MNIKSHIRKIIALAFVVLSLSFIFPAATYAATPSPEPKPRTCNDSNRISEEYILTNVAPQRPATEVLSRYNLGSAFSGVYNVETRDWIALPSDEKSSLKEDKDKGNFCIVSREGGHEEVAKRFNERIIKEKGLKSENLIDWSLD